mgnify:CR=1 FL=1
MFISINHKDFILIWIHFIPAMFMLWQLFALQIGFPHFYNFSENANIVVISVTISMTALWLFAKTTYYLFYSMSYSLESKLNKWMKVLNMVIIFGFSIIMTYALFNRKDNKQQELGYLTIFIIVTLLILNLIVTLNPI